jgi:molybdopterin synthase catalytic subunit
VVQHGRARSAPLGVATSPGPPPTPDGNTKASYNIAVRTTAITSEPLDIQALLPAVASDGMGAVATFLGLVRNHNQGRRVLHLVYEAYEPLAEKALLRIVAEAHEQWPSVRLALHHRTGQLAVGEASVAIAAGSPHRADAFAACRYAIERVKQIVPIWKHEYFEGGDVWIEGATADPDDRAARETATRIACA